MILILKVCTIKFNLYEYAETKVFVVYFICMHMYVCMAV